MGVWLRVISLIIIMRIDEQHPIGTGIFDEEEHSHSQLNQMEKETASSPLRNLLVFVLVIVLIIISVNFFSFIDTPSIEERKTSIKKQIFQPIREQLPLSIPKLKEVHQKNDEKAMTHQLASMEPSPQGFQEEWGFGQYDKRTEGKSQPEVLSSAETPQQLVQMKQQKKNDQKRSNQMTVEQVQSTTIPLPQSSKEKTYPISQQVYNSKIYSGQIHYSRIPVQYWQHRILMLKAMGLNTLSVYVMWNYHQIQRERFDYTTENKNLTKFLQLAVKHKMKVLLRPGPYICGEWDFGGLPARLLGIDGLVIRTANKLYLEEVEIYFKSLAPLIKPYLNANGGPIKMLQIQNELGSARAAPDYTNALVEMWDKLLGVSIQYYIEDAAQWVNRNYFQGAAVGVSDGSHQHDYTVLQVSHMLANDTFVFGGEVYTGWMTHWGQRWGDNLLSKFRSQMEFLFQTQREFSLYMAHGGTNFGLTAGANSNAFLFDYQPMITSYDYNATISEQGRRTVKSDMIVDMMNMYVRPPTVPFPQPISAIKFEEIVPKLTASLMANLGEAALKNEKELYFFQHDKLKMYNQGIIVYETFLTANTYTLDMQIHDFALIFVDGVLMDHRSRISTSKFRSEINCEIEKCKVQILVEAMGHSNYGEEQQQDKKGLLKCDIYINRGEQAEGQLIENTWNFYKINIDQTILKMDKISTGKIKYPAILKQHFNLPVPGDTYINMKNYGKGYVWVNGRNLGRYWNRGPQFRLYCPGVWLKQENNEIVILELLSAEEEAITGEHELVEIKKQQT